jgi:hypothetical protein
MSCAKADRGWVPHNCGKAHNRMLEPGFSDALRGAVRASRERVMTDNSAVEKTYIYIEQEETNKFKVQTDQLEQIGAQLRGKREFSIFNSIILPLIVSVATILFSSAFQYVSWFNSVGIQHVTDVANKAAQTYENAAAAIGTRHYAMLVFLPSLRDLVLAKAKVAALSAMAQGKTEKAADPSRAQSNAKKQTSPAELSPLRAMAQRIEEPKESEISLHKVVLDVKQKRFASYYEQLKQWNENYDRLLSDIEYALDRPVFAQAGKGEEEFRVSRAKIRQINCLNPMTGELQSLHLNPDSLKFRFAGIHNCFMQGNSALDEQLTEAIAKPEPIFSQQTEAQINQRLDHLLAMANEFRCYAHQRIDYYNSQKELAIFSAIYVWRRLADSPKTEALKHFEDATARCNG